MTTDYLLGESYFSTHFNHWIIHVPDNFDFYDEDDPRTSSSPTNVEAFLFYDFVNIYDNDTPSHIDAEVFYFHDM